MDFHHGDIAPKHILVDASGGVMLLDLFDMSPVGDGRIRTPDFCPEGWEKLSEKQIDRYATLVICRSLLEAVADERLDATKETIGKELERPSIETFEPALIALRDAFSALHEPPVPRFLLVGPAFEPGPFKSDDGVFFLRVRRPGRGRLQYQIAGVDQELIFETEPGKPPSHWFTGVSYNSLMHASLRGTPVRCAIDIGRGSESGFDRLLEFLQHNSEVPIEEDKQAAAEEAPAPISAEPLLVDVSRYWRGLIELEESFQPEVEILREMGSRGGMAVYAYERLSGDFDFDAESSVEVRLYGRKVGEVDVGQTDERALVLRHVDRLLRTGDRVTLVDRRSRASLYRRRKAVERILDGEAALPTLPAYFSPRSEAVTEDYGTEVDEEVLDEYRLNSGQKLAFRHIVRYGPVGLLQGPPGTGKTHFIAALVHWLVTRAGAQKILIASQSHEAVNNAIEKLVDLFKGLKRRPNLLRIGSKGITQKIRPFHTMSSRDGYKVRFDNAFKHRITSLGSAVGLRREFVADAVEIERLIGRPVNRIVTLTGVAGDADGMAAEDRRRYDSSLRSAVNAFVSGGRKLTGRELDVARATEELDDAFDDLLERHEGTSPSDVAKVRGLISLSLEWSDALGTSQRNFEEFLAKTRTIVTATCVGAGQTRIRIDARAYDWVIVDEAARCTSGELAVPIQVGRRVLLVGDHLQLRPMIDRRVLAELAETMPGVPPEELSASDFERVYASDFGKANGQVLTEQYRMAPEICDLVSEVFYEPHHVRLVPSEDRKPNPAFSASLQKPLSRPLCWVDTSAERNHVEKTAEWNRHSFWNEAEVIAVIAVLDRISRDDALVTALAAGESETPIGVICMYSAQKVKLEQVFLQRPWEARFRRLVRIDTVDSYQGKENEIVIVSLVRCNQGKDSGHVRSPNRANVAFSRSRERLIVVGAKSMWSKVNAEHPIRATLEFMNDHPKAVDFIDARSL
jgi:hypothetical protein